MSYVDDVTWIVEGTDVGDVSNKLERCATGSLQCADRNAVCFEESKTEAILFSKRRKHKRCRQKIRVGIAHWVHFNPDSTWWLSIWLEASPSLAKNRQKRIEKTREAEGRLAALPVGTGCLRRRQLTSSRL